MSRLAIERPEMRQKKQPNPFGDLVQADLYIEIYCYLVEQVFILFSTNFPV